MPMFRCQNPECSTDLHGRLIFDFENADNIPQCPKCQADARKPEFAYTIVKLETIHFHVKDPKGPDVGRGSRYKVACDGKSMAGRRATGAPTAVTCPECKKTPDFTAVNDEYPPLADKDFAVTVDADKQQYVKDETCC